MPKRNPTILVLDSDLGFMLALSQELSRRQIAVIPSRSVREAQSLLAEFRLSLNLLLMHCGRPGACAFVEEMTKAHPHVKIVGIVSERHRCRRSTFAIRKTGTRHESLTARMSSRRW
jgi:DNA-binding NtrC family response regulator